MNEATSPALDVAMAYYKAWTSKDMDQALSYLAEDVVCDAPAGRLEGVAAYRDFIGPFVGMLIDAQLIAAFGDDDKALIMYDTQTALVGSAPAAECVTVENGRITHSRFIFDRAPFEAARRARGLA